MRPPTKSSTRRTVLGGQFSEAVSKRLAKAADRQGGDADPGEKTILRATNNISATDCRCVGAVSMVCIKLSGRMMEYNWVIKSPRSMLMASPGSTSERVEEDVRITLLTLTRKKLKGRYDTQETVLNISRIHLTSVFAIGRYCFSRYQLLQNLDEIFEKVDVHKMGKFGYALQRCWEQWCRTRVLQYAEVENKKQLQRLCML